MKASRHRTYNTSPLAESEAKYVGREVPTESANYPDIIHQPLKALYHKRETLKAAPVNIFVYSSGIVIQDQGEINWFPIQNFYCSAALILERTERSVEFRDLSHAKKSKKPRILIFAMVVRQPSDPHSGLGRRVLMCHAFMISSDSVARRLIDATQLAYQNKDGWNHPMNDRQFLNAKIDFTIDKITSKDEESMRPLKDITQDRDRQLARLPTTPRLTQVSERSMPGHVVVRTPSNMSQQSRRSSTRPSSVVSTPRVSRLYRVPNQSANPVPNHGSMALSMAGRMSMTQASAYYQGFTTDVLSNGVGQPIRSRSVIGPPMNGSASQHSIGSVPVNLSSDFNGMRIGHRSRRQMSAPATPKSHRVLASSEPMEPINGYRSRRMSNGQGSIAVMDWDEMLDPSPVEQGHQQKPKLQANGGAQMNGGIPNKNHVHQQVQSSTPQSMASESGYSITKVDLNGNGKEMGEQAQTFADQKL